MYHIWVHIKTLQTVYIVCLLWVSLSRPKFQVLISESVSGIVSICIFLPLIDLKYFLINLGSLFSSISKAFSRSSPCVFPTFLEGPSSDFDMSKTTSLTLVLAFLIPETFGSDFSRFGTSFNLPRAPLTWYIFQTKIARYLVWQSLMWPWLPKSKMRAFEMYLRVISWQFVRTVSCLTVLILDNWWQGFWLPLQWWSQCPF